MKQKKTVLQVTGTMNRGGAETMLMGLLRQLKDDFRFVFLINKKKGTISKGNFDDEITALGGEIMYIDAMWDIGITSYIHGFSDIVSQIGKVDVVHCHLNSKCGVVSKAARKSGIDHVIAHSHACLKFRGSLPRIIANYSELFYQKQLINKYATDYWACSKESLGSLFSKKNINSSNCFVINNAIDVNKYLSIDNKKLDSLRKTLNIPKDRVIIGTVGRIARVKNYDFLIEVLNNLKKKNFSFYFILVGLKQDIEYTKKVFDKIKEYNLENDILYIEPRSDLEYIYPIFDVFVGASLSEGLGMVAIEAQAAGTKCVLSEGFLRCVDMRLGIVNFVDKFNAKTWAEEIIKCVKRPNLNDKEKIRRAIKINGYDIEEEASKVKKLYKEDR